jgi:hypothetical protein
LIRQAIESVSQRQSTAPRTILGFLLGMYGTLVAASAAMVIGLVASDSAGYIPWVLGFGAAITVALGAAVIIIAWKDPSRLMLGPITANEYTNIRRLHLGDDQQGEHSARVIGATLVDDERAVSEEESQTSELARPPEESARQIGTGADD